LQSVDRRIGVGKQSAQDAFTLQWIYCCSRGVHTPLKKQHFWCTTISLKWRRHYKSRCF